MIGTEDGSCSKLAQNWHMPLTPAACRVARKSGSGGGAITRSASVARSHGNTARSRRSAWKELGTARPAASASTPTLHVYTHAPAVAGMEPSAEAEPSSGAIVCESPVSSAPVSLRSSTAAVLEGEECEIGSVKIRPPSECEWNVCGQCVGIERRSSSSKARVTN